MSSLFGDDSGSNYNDAPPPQRGNYQRQQPRQGYGGNQQQRGGYGNQGGGQQGQGGRRQGHNDFRNGPYTMPFGKHQGTPVRDLPVDYLIWLWFKRQGDPLRDPLSTEVKMALESYNIDADGECPEQENRQYGN